MADDIEEKKKCFYCKQKGHFKRNCPKMKCFYCGENHQKKHCIKYYLEKTYKRWQKNIIDNKINKSNKSDEKTNIVNRDKTTTQQKPEVNVGNTKETHGETKHRHIKKKEIQKNNDGF